MLLSNYQKDALTELVNIGVGKGSATLNEIVTFPVTLHIPEVNVIHHSDLLNHLSFLEDKLLSGVNLNFSGDLTGFSQMIFPKKSAQKLVAMLMGENELPTHFDELHASSLTEVGNIVLNSLMGSLSNFLEKKLRYVVPTYEEGSPEYIFQRQIPKDAILLFCQAHFEVESLNIQGDIIILFTLNSFETLKSEVEKLSEEPLKINL